MTTCADAQPLVLDRGIIWNAATHRYYKLPETRPFARLAGYRYERGWLTRFRETDGQLETDSVRLPDSIKVPRRAPRG